MSTLETNLIGWNFLPNCHCEEAQSADEAISK